MAAHRRETGCSCSRSGRRVQLFSPGRFLYLQTPSRRASVGGGKRFAHHQSPITTHSNHQSPSFAEASEGRQITAFLIDIWRLEMAVNNSKQTMGAQSNRHCYDTPCAPIFGGGNGEVCRYESRPDGKSRSLVGQNAASVGMTTKGRSGRAVIYSRRLRDGQNRPPEMRGGRYKGKGDPPSPRLRRASGSGETFEVMT
jgi:hypothetical protein